MKKRKILFVWTGVTSYMADCWRALAAVGDIELKIVIDRANTTGSLAFDEAQVLRGLDCVLVSSDAESAFASLGDWIPDAAFIVGWHSPVCRAFAQTGRYRNVAKILVFDMPWEWKARKFAARFVLARYLRLFDACYVPGARARRYARWLGFSPEAIFTGLFSVKEPEQIGASAALREPFFLYVGRLSPEKRIRKLAAAYRAYRKRSETVPWKLVCCGMGEERHWLAQEEGVELRGFLQPDEVHALQCRAGALVLTSKFDPWPLVILESVSVGLPVICTPACGDHVELVGGNGIVTEDTASAMLEMTRHWMHYVDAAQSAVARARPYGCGVWAKRTHGLVEEVMTGKEGGR